MIVDVEYGFKCPCKKDVRASREECSICDFNNWLGRTFAQCKISCDMQLYT